MRFEDSADPDIIESSCSPVRPYCVLTWFLAIIGGALAFCIGMVINIIFIPLFFFALLFILLPRYAYLQWKHSRDIELNSDEKINDILMNDLLI